MRAVVMGGTSGIGLATAERLAGAERLDGTDRGAVAAFFKRLGQFEHLVLAFSPGAVGLGPIREISLDDFETAFTAKLFGYVHAIRQAQVTESITMISAASARAALPGTVTLAAVNGAIERMVSPPAGGGVPAGRIGTAADVAGGVAYLVGASLVTGTILPMDGGFTVA